MNRKQLDLGFGVDVEPRARHTDPDTSKRAASSMKDGAREHRSRILVALDEAGIPLTAEEIADRIDGMDGVQVARRMREMLDAGLVVALPETGKTQSGRDARRYALGEGV